MVYNIAGQTTRINYLCFYEQKTLTEYAATKIRMEVIGGEGERLKRTKETEKKNRTFKDERVT